MDIVVGVLMGSTSDLETMEHTAKVLDELGIGYEMRVLSAHRTPEAVREYASQAADRGLRVIIAAAGGAAHLAGVIAAQTRLPVVGIPIETKALGGMDSLLSTVQMPGGVPVATMAIGRAGAVNAAVFAAEVIALGDDRIRAAVEEYRQAKARDVLAVGDPRVDRG